MKVVSLNASFATARSRSTCTVMHINTNPAIGVCSVRWWELGRFSLFVSLLLRLDSQARCCADGSVGYFWSDGYELGMCSMLRPGRKERPEGPPRPHVARCTTTVSSCTCRGWGSPRLDCLTAEPSSLGTLSTLDVIAIWRSNRWWNSIRETVAGEGEEVSVSVTEQGTCTCTLTTSWKRSCHDAHSLPTRFQVSLCSEGCFSTA